MRRVAGVFLALAVFSGLFLLGCSGTTVVEGGGNESMQGLAEGYMAYMEKNKRPPRSPEDIQPLIPADKNPDQVVQAIKSGEIVVAWGTNPTAAPPSGPPGPGGPTGPPKPMVIAYPKQSSGPVRPVFTNMGFMMMAEEDFQNASFPSGHSPQS